MNVGDLTIGYFSKDETERERVINRILAECLLEIKVGNVNQNRLKEHIKILQTKAVDKEHYEVAEVFKVVINRLENEKQIGL